MQPLTYLLTPGNQDINVYYQVVEELARESLRMLRTKFHPLIDHITGKAIKAISDDQICLELLLLGIYARRGLVGGKLPTITHLEHVLDCQEQSGDFVYLSSKLRKCLDYFSDISEETRVDYWKLINQMTDWFEKRSQETLAEFTAPVEHFLASKSSQVVLDPDHLLATTPIIEYHINMVGAEILNMVWQESFMETKQQLVVLPGCLRPTPASCTSVEWVLGRICRHCNQSCQVSEVTKLGEGLGFQVSFVKHKSTLVSHVNDLEVIKQDGKIGILGVACVPSLLEGGFMLETHHVPAQCVPLNYSSCLNWDIEGINTQVNIKRIIEKARWL